MSRFGDDKIEHKKQAEISFRSEKGILGVISHLVHVPQDMIPVSPSGAISDRIYKYVIPQFALLDRLGGDNAWSRPHGNASPYISGGEIELELLGFNGSMTIAEAADWLVEYNKIAEQKDRPRYALAPVEYQTAYAWSCSDTLLSEAIVAGGSSFPGDGGASAPHLSLAMPLGVLSLYSWPVNRSLDPTTKFLVYRIA